MHNLYSQIYGWSKEVAQSIETLGWKEASQRTNLPDNDHLLVPGKSVLSDVDQYPLIHKQYTHHWTFPCQVALWCP